MSSNCFGFNLSRKSRNSDSFDSIDSNNECKNSPSNNVYIPEFTKINNQPNNLIPNKNLTNQPLLNYTPVKQIPEMQLLNCGYNPQCNNVNCELKFDTRKMKLFMDQNIQAIRSKEKMFDDVNFLKVFESITVNEQSLVLRTLMQNYHLRDLSELEDLIKWERISVTLLKNLKT